MSTAISPHLDVCDVAWQLDAHGFAGAEEAVAAIVRRARANGIDDVTVDVLADLTAPEAVRLRAFGRVAMLVARQPQGRPGPALQPAA